jgi:hypothetical protein
MVSTEVWSVLMRVDGGVYVVIVSGLAAPARALAAVQFQPRAAAAAASLRDGARRRIVRRVAPRRSPCRWARACTS